MAVAQLELAPRPWGVKFLSLPWLLVGIAVLLTVAQWVGILPESLHRLLEPEDLALDTYFRAGFDWVSERMFTDLFGWLIPGVAEEPVGLFVVTRAMTDMLEWILRCAAHLTHGANVRGFAPGYWIVGGLLFVPLIWLLEGRRAGLPVLAAFVICGATSFYTAASDLDEASLPTFWSLVGTTGVAALGIAFAWRLWTPLALWAVLFLLAAITQGFEIGPLPWTSVAVIAGVAGYATGGWRLTLLAAGTFTYAAIFGQWEETMQTVSVLMISVPVAVAIGLLTGVAGWRYKSVDRALVPILSILQTLPFFTYLVPAVIFFKVGPTAGSVATILYAIPPMILMTTLGLKKVSPEIVEAGKMVGSTRLQMLTRVMIPSARTEILVGVNQVFMLSLAMVVITSIIGNPGLGAELLADITSFKIGSSFEIGITIVLLAVMLDRITKAWVAKQPEHFERGTAWWRRNTVLLVGLGLLLLSFAIAWWSRTSVDDITGRSIWFVIGPDFNGFSWFASILDEVGRRQDISQGRALDDFIKDNLLQQGWLKTSSEAIGAFMNNYVLTSFRNFLLSIPTPAFVIFVVVFAYAVGGLRSAIIALVFFAWVVLSGWWDPSVRTIYIVLSSTIAACLVGLPLAIWAGTGGRRAKKGLAGGIGLPLVMDALSFVLRRLPIFVGALITGALIRHVLHGLGLVEPETQTSTTVFWAIFAVSFALYWWWLGRMERDKFMLVVADTMQTFPSFVYLIPAIMLFRITPMSVLLAVMIFSIVPLVRYTIEGLRNVPAEIVEAAEMSGATRWQVLTRVQLPLAVPTMAIGFNQALMFSFFMAMIAAYIGGTQDLGEELKRTLAGPDIGTNLVLGLNVAFMALVFDLTLNRWAEGRKKALGL